MKQIKILLIPVTKAAVYNTEDAINTLFKSLFKDLIGIVEGTIDNFNSEEHYTVNNKTVSHIFYITTLTVETGLKSLLENINKDISCIIIQEDDTVLCDIDSVSFMQEDTETFEMKLITSVKKGKSKMKEINIPNSFYSILTVETFDNAINSVIEKHNNRLK